MKSTWTPIVCSKTKEPIRLGDLVKNTRYCGTLYFEDYLNQFVIRSSTGGNIKNISYIEKIKESFENQIDNTSVECRSRLTIHKNKF